MVEADMVENIEFKWIKKRGVGGKRKEVQFYESFTFDGVNYALFDSVYLYKEGEPEPYIGMLIKIWEQPDKAKKVKILWFFRPCEIKNYIGDEEVPGNELFLASGEGVGLANVNPLEAIAGKCSVVCISKDSRNPQPSDEEVKMADFIFYRIFDIGQRKVLDKIDEKIAGHDVKILMNKLHLQDLCGALNRHSEKGKVTGNVENPSELCKGDKPVKIEQNSSGSLPKGNVVDLDISLVKENRSLGVKADSGAGDVLSKISETSDRETTLEKNSSVGVKDDSGAGAELSNFFETSDKEATPRPDVHSNLNGIKSGDIFGSQVELEEKVKSNKDSSQSDTRLSKKAEPDSSVKSSGNSNNKIVKKLPIHSDGKGMKPVVTTATASEDKSKRKLVKDSSPVNQVALKKPRLDEKLTEPAKGKLAKASPQTSNEVKIGQVIEVTRRPDADRSKWFRGLPWEERMEAADKQGRLVLLQNLDPSYTSGEVEDIVWHGFKESCTAKMIQKTAFSSPYSGQAIVIFKTREAAETTVRKLEDGCLLLPNGRPLVGSATSPCSRGKQSTFCGHIVIDKLKLQMQRDMKQAVSTSHCSQPNTLEYDLAMEWCLKQDTSDLSWKKLYKGQGEELRKLKASLKSK